MLAFPTCYVATWATACLVALVLIIGRRDSIELFRREYWALLLQPWKVVTFLVAGGGLVAIVPWASRNDYTWDYVDATFMSVLTFATAPWAVGSLYRALRRQASLANACIAACVWMFSASWSYDLWLLARDGEYPPTWAANIVASSCLYLPAGMLWSLAWRPDSGMHFAFSEPDWPRPAPPVPFRKLAPVAAVLMLLAGAQIVPFLL